MHDSKLIRENFEQFAASLKGRGEEDLLKSWPELDKKKRELLVKIEDIRAFKNSSGKSIAQAKKNGEDVSSLLKELSAKGNEQEALEKELKEISQKLIDIEYSIPNTPHESVPEGKDESSNREEKSWGEKPQISNPLPHWEIAENLGIVDFERAAKLSGARFALYIGDGARLERAIANFMLDKHKESGYQEVIPPLMVRSDAMYGAGQLPKFADDAFKLEHSEQDFYLIPTSEVTLCNIHSDEILSLEDLPIKYTSFTPCFRSEAGSYGKDVRGLIRLHQFNKVELVKICTPESSFDELESLTRNAEEILETLNLPYRKMTLCTGDMGFSATKTYDLEVWLPSQNTYREISSCSNTASFQARRNKTRFKRGQDSKPEYVHMLNGSGLAVGRTFVAILENYLQEDGSITIPEALRPYMGGQERIGLRKI